MISVGSMEISLVRPLFQAPLVSALENIWKKVGLTCGMPDHPAFPSSHGTKNDG